MKFREKMVELHCAWLILSKSYIILFLYSKPIVRNILDFNIATLLLSYSKYTSRQHLNTMMMKKKYVVDIYLIIIAPSAFSFRNTGKIFPSWPSWIRGSSWRIWHLLEVTRLQLSTPAQDSAVKYHAFIFLASNSLEKKHISVIKCVQASIQAGWSI